MTDYYYLNGKSLLLEQATVRDEQTERELVFFERLDVATDGAIAATIDGYHFRATLLNRETLAKCTANAERKGFKVDSQTVVPDYTCFLVDRRTKRPA